MGGLVAGVTLLRPSLDRRLRRGDPLQALLAPSEFVGDRHPVGHVRPVRRLGPCHQLGHLGLQLRLDPVGVVPRQRAVAAGVGVDLGAVEPDRAELQQAHLPRHLQHLDEQGLDPRQEAPPERRDRVVVGMLVRRHEAECHAVVGGPLELPTGEDTGRVAVDQEADQHRRVVRGRPRSPVAPAHRRQVQTVHHLDDEPRQMPLGQPLVHRGRKQIVHVAVDRAKVAHLSLANPDVPTPSPYRNPKSPLSPTSC